jgi:pyruvate/2-oxoglutarate dehydrogenase complex dihydrolipoamide dehydrogenase (E3) component
MMPGRKIVRFTRVADGFFNVEIEGAQGAETLSAERVLVATGRRPALRNLNLEALGLETDERGRLRVGDDMRVHDCENIFAAGDVVGQRMVVHHAHIEAGIAGENAVKDGNRKWARRSNVQVVFSDPEFAFAGQSPETAEKAGHKIVTATAESRDIGKLHLAGDDFGFGEFVADADDGRLLGAGLLCDDAANLIHLPAYAIDHQHTIHALIDGEYYHPTKIEIVSEIGDALVRALGGTPFFRATE